jgi:putative tryptophan/tyrosine transport system substrate-binding protein
LEETAVRRRRFIAFIGIAGFALPLAVRAQPTPQIPKIGWLKIQGRLHTPSQLQAFREGMKALGLIEGRDFVLLERYADGDEKRLPGLAADLVKSGVTVIVATSQPSIAAAWRVTKSIPMIGRMVDDPVADGMAQSLARPGGNVTGIYTMTEEMNPKRLELLKEAVPSVRRVGVLMRQDFPSVNIARRIGRLPKRRPIDWQSNSSR